MKFQIQIGAIEVLSGSSLLLTPNNPAYVQAVVNRLEFLFRATSTEGGEGLSFDWEKQSNSMGQPCLLIKGGIIEACAQLCSLNLINEDDEHTIVSKILLYSVEKGAPYLGNPQAFLEQVRQILIKASSA